MKPCPEDSNDGWTAGFNGCFGQVRVESLTSCIGCVAEAPKDHLSPINSLRYRLSSYINDSASASPLLRASNLYGLALVLSKARLVTSLILEQSVKCACGDER